MTPPTPFLSANDFRASFGAPSTYTEYLEEQMEQTLSYSEYLAGRLDQAINYSEYLSEQLTHPIDVPVEPAVKKRAERHQKLNRIFKISVTLEPPVGKPNYMRPGIYIRETDFSVYVPVDPAVAKRKARLQKLSRVFKGSSKTKSHLNSGFGG